MWAAAIEAIGKAVDSMFKAFLGTAQVEAESKAITNKQILEGRKLNFKANRNNLAIFGIMGLFVIVFAIIIFKKK